MIRWSIGIFKALPKEIGFARGYAGLKPLRYSDFFKAESPQLELLEFCFFLDPQCICRYNFQGGIYLFKTG